MNIDTNSTSICSHLIDFAINESNVMGGELRSLIIVRNHVGKFFNFYLTVKPRFVDVVSLLFQVCMSSSVAFVAPSYFVIGVSFFEYRLRLGVFSQAKSLRVPVDIDLLLVCIVIDPATTGTGRSVIST